MASRKTKVVEHLWEVLNAENRTVVTKTGLGAAIRHCNKHHDTRLSEDANPFNFMKDLLRGPHANANWPASLKAKRITGRQAMGGGSVMEFTDFPTGQDTPFVSPFEPTDDLAVESLQSISIPLTTKTLGRSDESWLVQVAVNLRVVEHHLATKSPLDFRELTHLQIAVKLGKASEVDALFWGVVKPADGEQYNVVVTCEAKQSKDPILEDQIVRQVRATFKSIAPLGLNVSTVVPIAIKSVKGGQVYVVEFAAWAQADADDASKEDLEVVSRGMYELLPPVPGVGMSRAALRKWSRKPAV